MSKLLMKQIKRETARHFGVNVSELESASRSKRHVFPRHVAMTLSYRLTRQSLTQIGNAFNRDHTTVLHAVKSIGEKEDEDKYVADTISKLSEMVAENSSGLGEAALNEIADRLAPKIAQNFDTYARSAVQVSQTQVSQTQVSQAQVSENTNGHAACPVIKNPIDPKPIIVKFKDDTPVTESLVRASKEVISAFKQFENNQFSRGEKGAYRTLRATMTTLEVCLRQKTKVQT